MYEDQIDPYEAAMEMHHMELDAREEAIGMGEIDAADEAEADYWIAEQEAELAAELAYERSLEDQGEDDPHERELWALDPQINGEGYEPYEPSPYNGDDADLPF